MGRPCAHCTKGIVNKITWMWLRFQRCRIYPVPTRVGIPKTSTYSLYENQRLEASNCATVVQSVSLSISVPFGYTLEISIIHLEFWLGVGCLDTKLSMFGKFLVCAWSQCGGLNEEHSISVWTSTQTPWDDIGCSSFKPPCWLQTCTKSYWT